MGEKGESPPPPEEGLARDRCPSCGGKLTYEPGRDQGFCAIEGIYVEVLVPPPEVGPPLVREAVLHATKRDLQRLCKAYGQRTSGNKTDLLTRLLRYMDEHGIDLPPEEIAEAAVAAPAQSPEAPAAEAAKTSEDAKPPEPGAEPPPHHGPDVDTLLAEVEHLAAQPPAPPPPPEEVPPKPSEEPPPKEPPTKPEPLFVEAAPEEEAFLLEAAGMAAGEEPVPAEVAAAEEPAVEPAVAALAPAVDAARLRRDRIAFYVGTLLVAAGGPGLIFGSVLHDAFRVPLFGDTYEAFGSVNMAAALLGGVVLAGGLLAMGVGLRGGIVRAQAAKEG